MIENVTRIMARHRVSSLSLSEIRNFTGTPDLDTTQAETWLNGLSTYIETAYSGEHRLFIEIVADYNRNRRRKFITADGIEISFCRASDNFLIFMCRPENCHKKYTLNNFNAFLKNNYTEV